MARPVNGRETAARNGNVVFVVILAVLLACGATLLLMFHDAGQLLIQFAGGHDLRERLSKLGYAAPFAFVAGYAVLIMLICVPSLPLSAIGGFLFGPVVGTVLSLAGQILGATVIFELSNAGIGSNVLGRNRYVRRFGDGFRNNSLRNMLTLRLLPFMPFGPIHVVAGAFKVPRRIFVVGTVIGMVPCTVICAWFGSGLNDVISAGAVGPSILYEPKVLWPLSALAALTVAFPVFGWLRRLTAR